MLTCIRMQNLIKIYHVVQDLKLVHTSGRAIVNVYGDNAISSYIGHELAIDPPPPLGEFCTL